jgi:uncharacterized protein YegL
MNKEELLAKFKKSNKVRRRATALKAGFASAEDYMAWLKGEKVTPKKNMSYDDFKNLERNTKLTIANAAGYETIAAYMSKLRSLNKISILPNPKPQGTIYNVHVLDKSGSMGGHKLTNAIRGINSELEELRKEKSKMEIRFGVVEFGSRVKPLVFQKLTKTTNIQYDTFGLTALNDAIVEAITVTVSALKPEDKAVIKIFTDGEENASRHTTSYVAALIADAKKRGVTVAFVADQYDMSRIIQKYGLDKSNTLVHENTAESIAKVYTKMSASTVSYSRSVNAGEDALVGFFSKVKGEL